MPDLAYRGTGRRKTSVARVRLLPGSGQVVINNRDVNEYLPTELLRRAALQPLDVAGGRDKFDVQVSVVGGGISGQAGAIRHGIARALLNYDTGLRNVLKDAGFLTRDPRMKERRKYGLKKARKAPQFSKR